MATYGKKTRSILPSLSVFRDSLSASNVARPDSRYSGAINDSGRPLNSSSKHKSFQQHLTSRTDEIDELASILLTDTSDEDENTSKDEVASHKVRMRSSQSAQTSPASHVRGSNGLRSSKQVGARGTITDGGQSAVSKLQAQRKPYHKDANQLPTAASADHGHIYITPAVPRKSSKRRSQQTRKTLIQKFPNTHDSYEMLVEEDDAWADERNSSDVDVEEEEIDAPKRRGKSDRILKQNSQSRSPRKSQDIQVNPKRRRLKESKVLYQKKSASTDQITGSSDSPLELRPDTSVSAGEDVTNDSVERTVASGGLYHNQLEPQKELQNDEQQLNKSRPRLIDSIADRQYEDATGSKTSRRPLSQTTRNSSTQSAIFDHDGDLVESYPESELENMMHTPKRQLRRTKKRHNLNYESDFDALFSSSPLGHSTPRIRLEPTDDDGKRVLRSVSANSPSLFDSASELDGHDDIDVFIPPRAAPNRSKKHPSPSKAELEDLEYAMETIGMLPKSTSNTSTISKNSKRFSKLLAPVSVLVSKDPNIKLSVTKVRTESKRQPKSNNVERGVHNQITTTNPAKRNLKMATYRDETVTQTIPLDKSSSTNRMDIDELQWDDSIYNIGMKRR